MQSFTKSKVAKLLVLMLVLLTVAVLGGCKGSDGSNGAAGTNGLPGLTGPTGSTGPAGPAGPAANLFGTHSLLQGAVDITTTITSVTNVGGVAKVAFHVATTTGNKPVTTITNSNLSFKIADLVPAGTGDNTFSTDYYEMWVSETPGKAAAVATSSTFTTPATNNLDVSDATNGNYAYTFVTPFGSTWPGYNNAGYAAANKKRVAIELSSPPVGYNKSVGILDIAGDPGAGNAATSIASLRQFVTIQACQKCHGPYMDNAAHANSRNDIRECDFCHSALYGSAPKHLTGFMAADAADLPVFIHEIHGSTWTDQDDILEAAVENPVTYPQPIQKCDVCHSDPSGSAPGDLTALSNWKTHPTGRVCASCHTTNVVTAATSTVAATFTHNTGTFTTKTAVPVGAKTDVQCAGCHNGLGTAGDFTDIVTVHSTTLPTFVAPVTGVVTTLSTPDTQEYNIVISLSTPSNGSYFVSGETPTVTITLTNPDGSAVPTGLTAAAGHQVGNYDPNSLALANMYVYGPRTSPRPSFLPAGKKSIPLLGTYFSASRSSCSTSTGTTTNTNINITPTATGWTYALQPIPAGTLPGTYFVRVYLGNTYTQTLASGCGTVPNQVVSVGITQFQVGSATEDLRIAGDNNNKSSCLRCHGNEIMHRDDHAAKFDTDDCNACHYVGARGNSSIGLSASTAPINNRVHAVHSAQANGDISVIDWSVPQTWNVESLPTSTITYPANIKRCTICHYSGNTSYKSNLYEIPCYGCHGDVPGATDHMTTMGGSLTSLVVGTSGTVNQPESCVVCHGPGKDVDIADTP